MTMIINCQAYAIRPTKKLRIMHRYAVLVVSDFTDAKKRLAQFALKPARFRFGRGKDIDSFFIADHANVIFLLKKFIS